MNSKKQKYLFLLMLALCYLILSPARAQLLQQGSKLVGTGNVGSAQQGVSVSLSADGKTAIVGGSGDSGGAGAAWVYWRSYGWTQPWSKLVGTGAVGSAQQGFSVSLVGHGFTAIVGGPDDNGGAGAVWVYTRGVLTPWTQQGSKLVGTGAMGSARQGVSVALSYDCNTAIVGGSDDNGTAGAAWVYTRSGSVWTQQGSKLVGTGAVGQARQGVSVALSHDGNTAIVGGFTDNSLIGAAWVYTRSGGVWTQQGSKLVGTGAVGESMQGYSVSISYDGNTAIVGGSGDNGSIGAAWVYTRSDSVWTQQGSKLVGTGAMGSATMQGYSVSLSGDGNAAIIGGAVDNDYTGAAWVYSRSAAGVWSQQGIKMVGTGAVGSPWQGCSVSFSNDGNTAIVGGLYDNFDMGAAWVYHREKPAIVSILDIPNDQGGNVRIKWKKFLTDTAGVSPQITSYGIWRKMPPDFTGASYKKPTPPQGMSLLGDSLGQYDYLMTVNAVQIQYYNVVVPTLQDSSVSGIPYFIFLITAHTANPNLYFVSEPDSSYSVDNLSPIAVTGVNAIVQSGPSVDLGWNPNTTDPDVGHYEVYRSTTNGFTPNPTLRIGNAIGNSFIDSLPITGAVNYYRVVTVDIHGNQSPPSPQVEATITITNASNMTSGWNLVSLPLNVSDNRKVILFPTAASNAYIYRGAYLPQDTINSSIGFWLKFNTEQMVQISGLPIQRDTVNVSTGWNIIGSISTPITSVSSIPPNIRTSNFFGYSGMYLPSDTIYPLRAYWAKFSQSGKLILAAIPSQVSDGFIKLLPTTELPPAPPGEEMLIPERAIPVEYALEQAFPSPFNPTTTIKYQLPQDSRVSLIVYNTLGQVVTTLADGIQQAGYKQVEWNAGNIPSGVYFYRLVAGDFIQVKKALLIR